MKIDFTKITTGCVNTWNACKPTVIKAGKVAVGVIVTALAKAGLEKLGVDLSVSSSSGQVLNFIPPQQYTPVGSKQEAMYAMYKPAMRMTSDYYRTEEAEKIFKMAKACTDDATKAFAVKLLSDMAASMNSSYYSSEVNNYISRMV